MITVHADGKAIYEIYLERNFNKLIDLLKEELGTEKKRICIVSDETVASYYMEALLADITPICMEATSFIFPAGEKNKNLDTVQNLYEHLIQKHFDRKDLLIALGGGVVGDLTGYAAATYLRGIDFIQVPTTLLSQVDSSIGGKTGVDFKSYKNMIGAFYQPSLVYINLSTLKTLTARHYLEGMGEIVKHSLIKDAAYFDWLSGHIDEIVNQNLDICEKMIEWSCQIKRQVVENDPKEQGERALLNFGHTLGHAIEKEMNFTLLHGECVAIGTVAASYLSWKRGNITEEEYQKICYLLQKFSLPVRVCISDTEQILEAVKHDKKMEAGIIKFILLQSVGCACIDRTVDEKELKQALESVLE